MQLPPILRQPAVQIIGEKCYVSLVENLNLLNDTECIKYSISKGLGLGIVLGGSIVKIPQILTILKNRSAAGLSLSSYIIETLSYFITLAYNMRQGNPFSTYGEMMFIVIQNIVIISLMFVYSRQHASLLITLLGLGAAFYVLNNQKLVSAVLMSSLLALTIPLNLSSKIPQIQTNFKNKSTGQLSVFTVVNYFAGSAARVFTNMTEVGDPLIMLGGVGATVLNGILLLQVIMYWNDKKNLSTAAVATTAAAQRKSRKAD
ncbi:hypothetical protein BDF20DRAFT_987297 [Mycotypha africana]|uniref:uncharacterized protein n=1 Tax=Mycotypha africana TaxID=64632 RepID=UPI002301704B|nr:uncharacterized protein BDF20DRAFT_987297 [Mycotypha africana]KAI8982395.1 hypothetical protein BDF20DRAFT_987297 [Mycotypha africana]